jgi:aminoacylase
MYLLTHKFHLLQFLSKDEYIKGIGIYESIIRALATHNDETRDEESRAEL